MAYPRIYACPTSSSISANDELPSPSGLTVSAEQIWTEDTGRAQSGSSTAKMIGKSITGKMTYAIRWDVLTTDSQSTATAKMNSIMNKLTRGFFKFGVSYDGTIPSGGEFYRSEITYEVGQAGGVYFKEVEVQVIER